AGSPPIKSTKGFPEGGMQKIVASVSVCGSRSDNGPAGEPAAATRSASATPNAPPAGCSGQKPEPGSRSSDGAVVTTRCGCRTVRTWSCGGKHSMVVPSLPTGVQPPPAFWPPVHAPSTQRGQGDIGSLVK